jgi:hypothetical protein
MKVKDQNTLVSAITELVLHHLDRPITGVRTMKVKDQIEVAVAAYVRLQTAEYTLVSTLAELDEIVGDDCYSHNITQALVSIQGILRQLEKQYNIPRAESRPKEDIH